MPTYCYRREDTDEVIELSMTVAEMEARQDGADAIKLDDGVLAYRHYGAEIVRADGARGWPLASDAAGVHPGQAKEAYEESVKRGVPTQFDLKTGCAIFEDRAHRKNYCRAFGYHDRDGGYGDP